MSDQSFTSTESSRVLAGRLGRKFSKFGDQLRSASKSLWILFEAGQTRLRHSRGDLRKKNLTKKIFLSVERLQKQKISKFGKNFLFVPKSLWILFEVGQTRLGHSRGDLRKKAGKESEDGRKDTYFFKNFLSVELNIAQLITFFLLIFMQRNLDIRNRNKKLHRINFMSKNNSTKNLTRNFLAELF